MTPAKSQSTDSGPWGRTQEVAAMIIYERVLCISSQKSNFWLKVDLWVPPPFFFLKIHGFLSQNVSLHGM